MNALSNYQIKNFFHKHHPITDEDCHETAVAIAKGGVAAPTPGQGAQSYTVRVSHHDSAEALIVQFRDPSYPLDVGLVLAAQGTQFWVLENPLGARTGNGMRFHARHVDLRQLFWKTLYETIGDVSEEVRAAIRVARMIGIFLANDDFDDTFPVEEGTRELAVFESVTLSLQDAYL